MKPWKALGSNGFHAGFFQAQWHLIGMSMVEEVTRILNGGFITNTLGSILISLILKVPNPIHVVDFKPIALCNVVYNVFIKILANQIKDILTSIIRESKPLLCLGGIFRIILLWPKKLCIQRDLRKIIRVLWC